MLLFPRDMSPKTSFRAAVKKTWSVPPPRSVENRFSLYENAVHTLAGWLAGLGFRVWVSGWLGWLSLGFGLGLGLGFGWDCWAVRPFGSDDYYKRPLLATEVRVWYHSVTPQQTQNTTACVNAAVFLTSVGGSESTVSWEAREATCTLGLHASASRQPFLRRTPSSCCARCSPH